MAKPGHDVQCHVPSAIRASSTTSPTSSSVSRETEIKHRSSITNRSVPALHRASSSAVPQNRPLRDPIMLERVLPIVNDALLDPPVAPLVPRWRTRPRRSGGRAVLRREDLVGGGGGAVLRRVSQIRAWIIHLIALHRVEALHDQVRGGRHGERILVSGRHRVRLILEASSHRQDHRVFYSRHRLRGGSMLGSRGRALASSHR